MKNSVPIAKILTAHGVRGLVKLRCFLENPEDITNYNPLHDDKGKSYVIALKNPIKNDWVAEIRGITDRNEAEKLRGITLNIPRDDLPAPKGEEVYHIDLIGMAAQDENNQDIGLVIAIDNFGAGDIIEIKPMGAASFYVPFSKPYLVNVDHDRKVISFTGIDGFKNL